MSELIPLDLAAVDIARLPGLPGCIVAIADEREELSPAARELDRLAGGALQRARQSAAFSGLQAGESLWLGFPAGLSAESVALLKLPRKADASLVRTAAAGLVKQAEGRPITLLADGRRKTDVADLALGLWLRAYTFAGYRTGAAKPADRLPPHVAIWAAGQPADDALLGPVRAAALGVLWTRDLVNEPANVLTTTEFARRLQELAAIGVTVEVLGEPELERLGMRALLAVGQGSQSPSQVVVMQWRGAGDAPPLALVGKGVCFDSGGVSIKPAAGMEEMTMDMAGAATVAGVMKTLALRKAPAHVVGLVGLVENMPDGRAQRPGDIVRSMKGATIEVVNTDAEGRMVLADVLWYAQERFRPRALIDLATLTGAIIVGLGHHQAGVFSNDDALAGRFLAAAAAEGEGAWRMPVTPQHHKQIESVFADIRNSAGREAGSCTAAAFLETFVRPGTPWMHLDIAGVASLKKPGELAPRGATGWGVLALNRLIGEGFAS